MGRGIKGHHDDVACHSVNFWRCRLEMQSFSCSVRYEHWGNAQGMVLRVINVVTSENYEGDPKRHFVGHSHSNNQLGWFPRIIDICYTQKKIPPRSGHIWCKILGISEQLCPAGYWRGRSGCVTDECWFCNPLLCWAALQFDQDLQYGKHFDMELSFIRWYC